MAYYPLYGWENRKRRKERLWPSSTQHGQVTSDACSQELTIKGDCNVPGTSFSCPKGHPVFAGVPTEPGLWQLKDPTGPECVSFLAPTFRPPMPLLDRRLSLLLGEWTDNHLKCTRNIGNDRGLRNLTGAWRLILSPPICHKVTADFPTQIRWMVLLSATENKPSGQESQGQVNGGADNEPHAFQMWFRRKKKMPLQLLSLYYQILFSHQPDLRTATISFIKSTEGTEPLWGSTNDS